jgi:hypothetical protein
MGNADDVRSLGWSDEWGRVALILVNARVMKRVDV